MKNKLIGYGLSMALLFGSMAYSIEQNPSYAISNEQLAENLDPTDLELQVAAANYLLDNFPNTVSGSSRTKLLRLLEEADQLLKEVYDFKNAYEKKDSTNIRVKNQIKANLDKRKTTFDVNVNSYATSKQLTEWFTETAKEDWYFYFSMYQRANVSIRYNPSKANGKKNYVESASFEVEYREKPSSESVVEAFADKWIDKNISSGDSDYDKVLKIHDFIVKENYYNRGDSKAMSGGHSIYHPASILYGNGGVCNAYATLFDKLATKAGLDVRYATGTSKKTGEAHIWNMVKVDGSWFNVDTTWDDPTISFNEGFVENLEDFVIYDYFMKSDEEIEGSRIIDQYPSRPQANKRINTGLKNSTIKEIDGKYRVIN